MNVRCGIVSRFVVASALLAAATIVAVSCGGDGEKPTSLGAGTPGEPTATKAAGKKGRVLPQPNGTLSGPIEISGKAASGTITLTVSEDGTSVTFVTVALKDLKCDGFSAGSMTKGVGGTFPVADGNLNASPSGLGKISGRFTSPTEASGKVDLKMDIPMAAPCELGEWKWSAKLDPNATPQGIPAPPTERPMETPR